MVESTFDSDHMHITCMGWLILVLILGREREKVNENDQAENKLGYFSNTSWALLPCTEQPGVRVAR